MGSWTGAQIRHQTYNGRDMTLKLKPGGQEVLIADGWVNDITEGVDHVHLWDLRSGDFHLHDLRLSAAALFPELRDDERSGNRAELAQRDLLHRSLVSQAQQLASQPVTGDTVKKAKQLQAEFNAAGKASSGNYHAFRTAMDAIFEAARITREQRQREWDQNKAAKEAIVREAESAATSSDLKAAGDRMRALSERWKQIGSCDKADNDRLWNQFNAARTRLHDRKQREFDERRRAWAQNKAAKESLVSQMASLTYSSDYRAAKDSARALVERWKQVGPCDKADNDRLWNEFSAAKTRLFDAARQDGERRKAEAQQRAQQRVWQLEEQLRNCEAGIYRAEESYSRALSARSPSFNNPNAYSIISSQQQRQSQARERLGQLQQRKAQIVDRLVEARSRLNQMY